MNEPSKKIYLSFYLLQKDCKLPVKVVSRQFATNIPEGEIGIVSSKTDTEYNIFWESKGIEETLSNFGGIACDLEVLTNEKVEIK